MRLALLTTLTMMAFAANSILTRAAVDGDHIDPNTFAIFRVVSGALVLSLIAVFRGAKIPLFKAKRVWGALSLAAYMVGFTLAYLTLDAGLGALILFGVTQITMFGYGTLQGNAPTLRQMSGAGVAFAGLLIVLWPGSTEGNDLAGALLMVMAGVGWAAYTLLGRGGQDPLADTAASFILCVPIILIMLVAQGLSFSPVGLSLAVISGGLTSGLGYALWYSILPHFETATAAVIQLSVPVIAILSGAVLLAEPLQAAVIISAVLVLGGIGWAVSGQSAPAGRK